MLREHYSKKGSERGEGTGGVRAFPEESRSSVIARALTALTGHQFQNMCTALTDEAPKQIQRSWEFGSITSATAFLPEGGSNFIIRMKADNTKQMPFATIKGHCPSIIP